MDEILDFFINLIADIMELVIECILPWKAKKRKKTAEQSAENMQSGNKGSAAACSKQSGNREQVIKK